MNDSNFNNNLNNSSNDFNSNTGDNFNSFNTNLNNNTSSNTNLNSFNSYNESNSNSFSDNTNKTGGNSFFKNKKIFMVLIVLVALIVILFGLKALFKKGTSSKEYDEDNYKYTTSFFIQNEEKKYALFNEDGKKLSDFEFTSVGEFIGGATVVKKDNEYGILNDKGKMVVNFGKYKSISQKNGLFEVSDGEKRYLLSGSGKKITDLDDVSIDTYIGILDYSLLTDYNKKSYNVLNFDGKSIYKFDIVESASQPKTSFLNGFVSISYNNNVYIIDISSGKKIASYDADVPYCINTVEEDGDVIILNSCEGVFGNMGDTYYRLIKNNKVYDLSDKCNKISYFDENILCTNSTSTYLLNDKLELGADTNSDQYKHRNGYAVSTSEGVNFYSSSEELLTTVPCRGLANYGDTTNDLYVLDTHYNRSCGTDFGTYEYYTLKGENAFGKSFGSISKFDKNNLAIVSEDKVNYYLMDDKGKKVSGDYSKLSTKGDYYYFSNDSKSGLLDKNGKEILSGDFTSIDVEKNHVLAQSTDGKYHIYNLDIKKEVFVSDTKPVFKNKYMTVTVDGKITYYTYTGKKIY